MTTDSQTTTLNNNNKYSKRIATNTLVLFARMLIITCVNLYTVRWVLHGLGSEDYGIFNAVAGVVTASTCISSVLALSTQRFYSYSMGRGEQEKLKDIFSVSLNIVVVLAIILLILFELVGPWFVSTQLTIPESRLSAALWAFQFSLLSFVFTLIQIPFIGAVFANEDMGIYALVSTLDCFSKLLIAYLIGHTNSDDLVFYGASMMLEAFIVMLFYMIIGWRKYEECRYARVTDKRLYKQLGSFSGWSFYGALSGVGMTQGSVIILNIFFGPIVNAAFSIANQIYNAINSLSNSIVIAFRPAMVKSYSSLDYKYLEQLFFTGNKALLYLLVIIALPFILETHAVLTFWLGYCTKEMVLFSRLYVIYTICLAMHNPITTIIQATGNIKKYSIYVESLTILSLPICWASFKLGAPSYSIFIVMIGLCSVAHIIRLYMLRNCLHEFTFSKYFRQLICPSIIFITLACCITMISRTLVTDVLRQFFITCTVSSTCCLLLIYLIGVNKQERALINKLAKKLIKK